MISQRPGDLLEIQFEGNWYYLVVVTKIFLFGGNIIYAFHTNGEKIENFKAYRKLSGFNICTDMLLPKKEGNVARIGKVDEPLDYLVSPFIKGRGGLDHKEPPKEWWIYDFSNPREAIARVKRLPRKYRNAMDYGMYSFDLTAKKVLDGYTPDQNSRIEKNQVSSRLKNRILLLIANFKRYVKLSKC